MRKLKAFAIIWCAIALLACIGPWADWLIMPPRSGTLPAPPGETQALFPFTDGQVEVWVRPPRNHAHPRLRVLSFCGQGDLAQIKTWDVVDLLDDDVPIEVCVMNYPGYGATTGPSRLHRLGPCALAAFDALQQKDPSTPLAVSGFSLGAVPALCVAARRPVAGVVVYNPPVLRRIIMRQGWWNLWALSIPIALNIPDDLDCVSNAGHIAAPGIVITSAQDEVAPFAFQQDVSTAYAGPKKVLVLDASHAQPLDAAGTLRVKEALRWWATQVVQAPRTARRSP